MARELTPVPDADADVLDHAREFVEVVHRAAPALYQSLCLEPRFADLLAQANTFNHGKLFAYAEFLVFREEFLRRFPQASKPACINAFSRLLLKNDISMTNLLDALEGTAGVEQRLLSRSRTRSPGNSF